MGLTQRSVVLVPAYAQLRANSSLIQAKNAEPRDCSVSDVHSCNVQRLHRQTYGVTRNAWSIHCVVQSRAQLLTRHVF